MGQASGIVPERGFPPPTGNPSSLQNPNVGFPYGWNWTSSVPVGSQATSSSYSGFGQNLGSFNPFGNAPTGGISGTFKPTPIGASSNPQIQGGNNVSFQQPPFRPRQMPNPSNQSVVDTR